MAEIGSKAPPALARRGLRRITHDLPPRGELKGVGHALMLFFGDEIAERLLVHGDGTNTAGTKRE